MELLYAHLQSGEEVAELFSWIEPPLFASKHSIHFPLPDSGSLMEKVLQLTLLLIFLLLLYMQVLISERFIFFSSTNFPLTKNVCIATQTHCIYGDLFNFNGRSSGSVYCLLSKIKHWIYRRTWRLAGGFPFSPLLCLWTCLMPQRCGTCYHSGQISSHLLNIFVTSNS